MRGFRYAEQHNIKHLNEAKNLAREVRAVAKIEALCVCNSLPANVPIIDIAFEIKESHNTTRRGR